MFSPPDVVCGPPITMEPRAKPHASGLCESWNCADSVASGVSRVKAAFLCAVLSDSTKSVDVAARSSGVE